MPKTWVEKVFKEANGNTRIIEEKLGLVKGTLKGEDLLIIEIKRKDCLNLRIPSGNELGINDLWLPGGITSGNIPEAVMDFSHKPKGIELDTSSFK